VYNIRSRSKYGKIADVEDADLGKAAETLPLLADVLLVADDDDVFQFVVVEVAGSQRHDEVAQTDQRRVRVGEQTDDHVVAQHGHCRLFPCLHRNATRRDVKHCSQHTLSESASEQVK